MTDAPWGDPGVWISPRGSLGKDNNWTTARWTESCTREIAWCRLQVNLKLAVGEGSRCGSTLYADYFY